MRKEIVPRFNAPQRVIHWAVGISFSGLLLSGLALAYPSLYWLTLLFGGGASTRILHPWIGVVYTVAIAAMAFSWARDMILDRKDRRWLEEVPAYATHRTEKVPDAGKYNAGQKLYFWISIVLGVTFLVTGAAALVPGELRAGSARG